ncbi:hypothetical protein [Nitrosopumilus sp.]|uniref:hypothetical protein n=1 Tax=Nitrosopumilus sp. TaxID=2024843 RepID=UPI00247E1AFB|nr:hypothetical protein [Nitrosopumilus sp.]MCV0411261.1 hypothetical protein [Nitrosopumilus sp.]
MVNEKNPKSVLKNRLSQELFFEIFMMPASGYKLAQIVQNTTKTPNTKSVYRVLAKLIEHGYITYKDKKYHHNPKTLTDELVKYLNSKDVVLDKADMNYLLFLVTNAEFFNHFIVDLNIHVKPKNYQNLLQEITNMVGMCAAILLYGINTSTTKPIPVRISLEKINERIMKLKKHVNDEIPKKVRGSKSQRKLQQKQLEKLYHHLLSYVFLFVVQEKIPKKALIKFATLWNQYGGFKIGVKVGKIDFKNNPFRKHFE